MLRPALLIFLACLILQGCGKREGEHRGRGLMVDLLSHPREAVITNPAPSFSWITDHPKRGAGQAAWHIIVASSREKLDKNYGDKWDSGKTASSNSVGIAYNGEPLDQFSTYWWKVRIFDHEGVPGRWSKPQQFHTGEFGAVDLRWPGESRWVELDAGCGPQYVFEDRHAIRYHDIYPESITRNSAGNHFITFEKAAFGTLRLKFGNGQVTDSATLIIHLGEKADGGRVDREPEGSVSYSRAELELKPGKNEYLLELPRQYSNYPNSQVLAEHMPEVAAFRFAEIEGWPGELESGQVAQHALLYRFDDDASLFSSSCDNLNMIWDLCKHTLKVTPFLGLYIDGTRERMPYEADAYIQQISHYCVDREFAIQRYTNAFLIFNPSWPTEWHLHIVLMAWADYMATGDKRFLEKYYDELVNKTLLALAREDGLISTRTGLVTGEFLESIHYHGTAFRDIVDWPQGTPAGEETGPGWFGSARVEGETDSYVFSDINTVVNAFHYRNLVLMEKIAALLEREDDRLFFKSRSALVKRSFNEKLLNKETGLYTDGEGVDHSSLHANMFPVAFGIAPRDNYPQIKEFLESRGMACSPYGAPYLFDALYELEAENYAFNLLTSETDRSWMNMIRFGTTITSEAWDIKYKNNMTWNHAWGASPVYIITRHIFGIEPLEPSFKKILISPRPGPLVEAEIRSPTIRGDIEVRFEREKSGNGEMREGALDMEIKIPAGTTANVVLPGPLHTGFRLLVNNTEKDPVIRNGSVVIEGVESGSHSFRIIPYHYTK